MLPAKRQTSVGRRLVTAARVMVPEMKCELDLYEYVLVQTKYELFTQSMYLLGPTSSMYYFKFSISTYVVHTAAVLCTVFTKILQWMLFYVVCLWETIQCVRDMYAVVLQGHSDWQY